MEGRPQFEPRFIVGIEQIDREHRRLFEIAGHAYEGLGASDDGAEAATRAAIAELLDYTATHFAHEEELMERAGYPGLAGHRRQHAHLLAQARDMEMRAEFGDRSMPIELNQLLHRWLVEHIEGSDRTFGEFVAARTQR